MQQPCYHFQFGLIVTGEGERKHLPRLFRPLMEMGVCSFGVMHKIGQRSPLTSENRRLRMVRSGKIIPDRDQEIGLRARRRLNENPCLFVILIDDLEHDRRKQAQVVFDRYRRAFDTMLTNDQQWRASVHFLVNMIEAYYFADANAVNITLNLTPPLEDYTDDVETIRHPKNDLKSLYQGFDEVEHGGAILAQLDVEHILSRSKTCASLRTLFAWCIKILEQYPDRASLSLDKFSAHVKNECKGKWVS